jgi:AcrR family transcriptional regulator
VSTSSSGPIWTQPAPGARKPKFTREQIAEIAIKIADQEGFEALSMRRLADELGAGTMTLYHYVRTKEDLIALIDDAIMAEVLVPPEALRGDWVRALGAIARASLRAFERHPWAMQSLSGARFGPNGMRHAEQSLAAMARAPFDREAKLDAISIVDEYVFGYVYRRAELSRHDELASGEPSEELIAFTRAQLATGEYPHMAALIGDDVAGAWKQAVGTQASAVSRFERGLAALFEGLRRMLPRARGRQRARRTTRRPARSRRRQDQPTQ